MRKICSLLGLMLAVGCAGSAGSDGKDGQDGDDGAPGATGPAGMNGKDGARGDDGAPGTNGADGVDGAPGSDGADGADGSGILQGTGAPAAALGADGDIYIDTVSRDVYQKSNGTWSVITNLSGGPAGPKGDPGDDGTDGTDGASVRTGTGVPGAGLGAVGDVYIDSTTGDLYAKGAGGWTKTGSLKGPAGEDGTDGVDVKDTLGGVRWFAFALTAGPAYDDAPQFITNQTYTDASSAASFTFTGANQHGRLAFQTTGSFIPGGVDLSAFEGLTFSASVTGAVKNVVAVLTEGERRSCQWNFTTGTGPSYSVDLTDLTDCPEDFSLASVTQIQVGIVSNAAGECTLTIDDIELIDTF